MAEKKNRILILDDDIAILRLLEEFFSELGYAVHTAEDGERGLELFLETRPDIVLVDLKMPRVNGFEVLERVTREAPTTPIIVISGEGEKADVIQALRLGAWNYLSKPIERLALIRHAVEQALEKAALLKENQAYREGLERKLSSIIENFPGYIFTCDSKCRITYANPAFCEYVGRELVGQRCYEVIFDLEHPCPWCAPSNTAAPPEPAGRREIQDPRTRRWFSVAHLAVRDRNDEVREHQVILLDITEQKLALRNLREREKQLRRENVRLRATMAERYRFGPLIGKSKPMQAVYEDIISAAGSEASVVISGESGTGKELVARAIHEKSNRRKGPLIYVNCGAIPENLIESEFFGYRKGAFTGATSHKPGYFDQAAGGTLFLDEIGEIPLSLQVKLLRAIEGNGYTPIGGSELRLPDVRLISATNRDLKELVREGKMRQDFFYRLHIIPIHLPPLRERKEDIPLLAEHFLARYDADQRPELTPKILRALQDYDWPGNVRELQNTLHRFAMLQRLDFLDLALDDDSAPETEDTFRLAMENRTLAEMLEEIEKTILEKAFAKYGSHQGRVADALGIDRKTLYRKMKQHRIRKPARPGTARG